MALAMSQHDYYGFPQQLPRSRIPAELSLHSFVDAQGDLSNDSANSPATPLSPVFTNPYHLPVNDDWLTWDDKDALSPDLDANLSFEDDYDFAAPELARDDVLRNVSVSPAVNPVDLAAPMADVVPFGRDGLSDTQPLFQSHAPAPRTAPEPSSASPAASASSSSDARPARKRKSPGSAAPSARSSASPPPTKSSRKPAGLPPKKTAHNMIEKRYRNNLNDKIAALRDSVPSLRVMVQRLEHLTHSDDADEEGDVGEEDLGGLAVAQKLNKATILGKATEYIAHLERKNQSLAKENANLRNQIEGFEVYVTSRGGSQGMWS